MTDLSCLRSVDAQTFNNAGALIASQNFNGVASWLPVVDGSFIVERPTVTLGKRSVNSVSPSASL